MEIDRRLVRENRIAVMHAIQADRAGFAVHAPLEVELGAARGIPLVNALDAHGLYKKPLSRRLERPDDAIKTLPVLMVTAEQKREQIVAAAEAGVNGYIVKPFTAATLKEKIDKIFARIEGGQ